MATDEQRGRAIAAIVGSQVADAAAVHAHWVYDPAKMTEACAKMTRGPAFMSPPGNGFYTPGEGGQSCYGDQNFVLLESLAETGRLDVEDFTQRTAVAFGKESIYEVEGAIDKENWPGNVKPLQMPIAGPWRHGSIKQFLVKYLVEGKRYPECGSDDEQVDGACKVVPLVALYAGDSQLAEHVETAIRATQNTDKAVSFGLAYARCLEQIILGEASTPAAAVRNVVASLQLGGSGEVAGILEDVLEDLASLSLPEVGLRLKPAASSFQWAGLA